MNSIVCISHLESGYPSFIHERTLYLAKRNPSLQGVMSVKTAQVYSIIYNKRPHQVTKGSSKVISKPYTEVVQTEHPLISASWASENHRKGLPPKRQEHLQQCVPHQCNFNAYEAVACSYCYHLCAVGASHHNSGIERPEDILSNQRCFHERSVVVIVGVVTITIIPIVRHENFVGPIGQPLQPPPEIQ